MDLPVVRASCPRRGSRLAASRSDGGDPARMHQADAEGQHTRATTPQDAQTRFKPFTIPLLTAWLFG
eukprot:1332072-Alexandrium_andersonii.AAC.1